MPEQNLRQYNTTQWYEPHYSANSTLMQSWPAISKHTSYTGKAYSPPYSYLAIQFHFYPASYNSAIQLHTKHSSVFKAFVLMKIKTLFITKQNIFRKHCPI